MNVSDIMTRDRLITCQADASIQQVARTLCENNIGSCPVVDAQGRLEGIVTDRDICCRIVSKGMSLQTSVRDSMSRDVHWVKPETDVRELESLMRQFKVRRMPVADSQGRLVGMVAQADLIRHLHGTPQEEHQVVEVLEEISTP